MQLDNRKAILRSDSLARGHRASFAAFLQLVKTRTNVDWGLTMRKLVCFIESNTSLRLGKCFYQELLVWLHLLDLHSDGIVSNIEEAYYNHEAKDLTAWKNLPPVVCVTLKVPRSVLTPLTGARTYCIGTPTLSCVVRSSIDSVQTWINLFAAVQIGFGTISTVGARFSDSFGIYVDEDITGWSGKSPLLVSFYVPTWVLLQEPRTARVGFGLKHNIWNADAFRESLGPELYVYQTTLADPDNVYITRHFPNQTAPVSVCGFVTGTTEKTNSESSTVTTTAAVDGRTARVTSLAIRVNLANEKAAVALRAGIPVHTTSVSPFSFAASLGDELAVRFDFTAPVVASETKTRIARKSSYIELISRVADGNDCLKVFSFMFSLLPSQGMIVSWNMPYLKMESLPILDTSQPDRISWLKDHVEIMFLSRAEALRRDASVQAPIEERDLIGFKDSLLRIFCLYTGVHAQQTTHIFGICCPEDGGVHILLLVSSVRLELSNRTIVLDAAVLPIHYGLVPQISPALNALSNCDRLCQVIVNKAQMQLWKQILPAWVERCRTWSHHQDCQYLSAGKIPLPFDKGQNPLCACGEGVLPTNFITDVPEWDTIAKYAVRVAISPVFSSVLLEDPYEFNKPRTWTPTNPSRTNTCALCMKTQGPDGSDLKSCAACHRAKYCSRECQREDWKKHKLDCKKSN